MFLCYLSLQYIELRFNKPIKIMVIILDVLSGVSWDSRLFDNLTRSANLGFTFPFCIYWLDGRMIGLHYIMLSSHIVLNTSNPNQIQ